MDAHTADIQEPRGGSRLTFLLESSPRAPPAVENLGDWRSRCTYPEYPAVLVVAVLPGVVLPGHSELVLAHVAQARVLARLHLSDEPAGKLRLGRAGETNRVDYDQDSGLMKHLRSTTSGNRKKTKQQQQNKNYNNQQQSQQHVSLSLTCFYTMTLNTVNPQTLLSPPSSC